MARKPTVWYREEDQWFYTTRGGKQIKLSRDKKEAEKAFHALMASDETDAGGRRPTFARLADEFLEHSKGENTAKTFETHRRFLQSFCDAVKGRKAPDIRPLDVTAWLKANPTWGQSTRTLCIQIVKAVINYAVDNRRLGINPLEKLRQGNFAHRERILTPEEREKIRAMVPPRLRDFIFALEQTGGRPFSEVARLTAAMIDWEDCSATLAEHKTAKHGKKRVIYFTPEMMELLRRLARKHPDGLLFRTRSNSEWSSNSFARWLRAFERELGIKGMVAYSYRHSYICDALERGVPLAVVAELVGNSVKVLIKYYVHMASKKDALKAAALKATIQ